MQYCECPALPKWKITLKDGYLRANLKGESTSIQIASGEKAEQMFKALRLYEDTQMIMHWLEYSFPEVKNEVVITVRYLESLE